MPSCLDHPARTSNLAASAVLTGLAALVTAADAAAQVLGLTADNNTKSAIVFDADSQQVLASIPLSGSTMGDCIIEPARMLGFVTDFQSRIWVIDLATSPPALAAGTNPIRIANPGEDLALSPDGRYLLVCDGINTFPVSVIDIDQRREVQALHLGVDSCSIDVGPDGTVLVTSFNSRIIRRLSFDSGAGVLSGPTGSTAFNQPNNVHIAPTGTWAAALGRTTRQLMTLTIGDLATTATRTLPGTGISAVFSAAGDRLWVRSTLPGTVDLYMADPMTGDLGQAPYLSFPVSNTPAAFGIDQMALHPDESRLYVTEPGMLSIYDAMTGARVGSITDARLVSPTGVCVTDCSPPVTNVAPTITAIKPLVLWPPNKRLVDVSGAFLVEDADGDPLTIDVAMLSNEPEGRGWCGFAPDFLNEWYEGGRGLLVRAERQGWTRPGRYYIAVISADDGKGGMAQHAVLVAAVPHDASRRSVDRTVTEGLVMAARINAALAGEGDMPEGLHEMGIVQVSWRSCWWWKGRSWRGHGR